MQMRARFCANCGAELPEGARFCPSCGTPTALADVPAPAPEPDRSAPPSLRPPDGSPDDADPVQDELRPITALFADVVGSTALGERLSPAEVKALIGECVSRMSRAVEEFGGVVQAYMGDGICGLFGVPLAREDDPERAARAALRILEVIGDYGNDIEAAWNISNFDVRVGINSGQTAVGVVGASDPQIVALGDTTNVAARLQSATAPGTIAVGDVTAKTLASRFDFEPMGKLEVKGRSEGVTAWRLTGPRSSGETSSATPLVGREQEIERLYYISQQLTAGRGGVLLLSGETGMGKTRLLTEFRKALPDGITWLEGHCLSYAGESAYLPFIEILRSWLGVEDGEAEVAVRTKLKARMGGLLGWRSPTQIPFLGRLLSVKPDPESEDAMARMTRGQVAEQIRRSYRAWIEALAYDRPLVIALEDLHWADPSTLALAKDLLAATDRVPVLVAATFRPESASPAWDFRMKVLADFPHRSAEVGVRPLSREASEALAKLLAPEDLLDKTITDAIVGRAEGNPLYLEELLRSLSEAGGLLQGRRWTMSVSAAAIVPAALENLLLARIDNLPVEARRLAQLAAVIGRTFPARVLELIYQREDIEEGLATLLRSQIVRELHRYPELEYTFAHGMLQEAALSTLTLENMREIYGQVGDAIEELHADNLEEQYELLAFYYYRSNDLAKALTYLERSAGRAREVDALESAAELYERAGKVAERLKDGAAQARMQAALAEVGRVSGERAGRSAGGP